MIVVRDRDSRGHTKLGWLDSRHSFSFGSYHDPNHMGFGALRVINDDRVIPGAGFGEHGHRDMEIVTVVLDGALEHRDSLGNGSVIRPGDVQRMSAGRGILHSEFNASKDDAVHFLQIWVLPEADGLEPGYEQKHFEPEDRKGQLRLVADRHGSDNAVTVHQDVKLYRGSLTSGDRVVHTLDPNRRAWLHVAAGIVDLNGDELRAGDGAAISGEKAITLETGHQTDLLLFDLA